jgi:hypothetical protein
LLTAGRKASDRCCCSRVIIIVVAANVPLLVAAVYRVLQRLFHASRGRCVPLACRHYLVALSLSLDAWVDLSYIPHRGHGCSFLWCHFSVILRRLIFETVLAEPADTYYLSHFCHKFKVKNPYFWIAYLKKMGFQLSYKLDIKLVP